MSLIAILAKLDNDLIEIGVKSVKQKNIFSTMNELSEKIFKTINHNIKILWSTDCPVDFPSYYSGNSRSFWAKKLIQIQIRGVSIASNLYFNKHIRSVVKSTARKYGLLFRSRRFFTQLLTFYKVQIRPYLEYSLHL